MNSMSIMAKMISLQILNILSMGSDSYAYNLGGHTGIHVCHADIIPSMAKKLELRLHACHATLTLTLFPPMVTSATSAANIMLCQAAHI